MNTVKPYSYSRKFQASRHLVWDVHTQVEHIKKWFGPAGTDVKKFDFNFFVGGINHYCIEVPGMDGGAPVEMWGRQVYQEITPKDRLVYIQSFSNPEGGIGSHPMSPSWPKEMHATVTFEDDGDGTLVTVTWYPHNSDELGNTTFDQARESMNGGFTGMFNTLEAYINASKYLEVVDLPNEDSIRFCRQIKAPRAMVWKAFADEESALHWWGPEGFTNNSLSREFKNGGQWRLDMTGPDGTVYENLIQYKKIEEPFHLEYQHGTPTDPAMFYVVTEFHELGNETLIVTTMKFRSTQERDVTLQHAKPGHASTMKKLDEYLAGLVS